MPAETGSIGGPSGAASPLWVAALRDAFPDVEWLDSDLDLGESRSIDWVGLDPTGRVVFALRCDGSGESAVILALDALVFFERNRAVFGQHLQSARVRASLAPIVALISDSFSEQLLARLCGLGAGGLRLLELRQLSSARGDRAYLVPVTPSFGRNAPPAPRGAESFLATLAQAQRPIAELLVKRIGRIDERLSVTAGDHSLSWRLGDEPLCSISQIEGMIEGQVSPLGEPIELLDATHVEVFVDHVLGRYVSLLSGTAMTPSSDFTMYAAVDAGMTLTPEEIAAFRQSG